MYNEDKGIHCPQCNFIIKFSLEELLMSNKITCPGCHLEMAMLVPGELKIHLQEIQQAQDNIVMEQNAMSPSSPVNPDEIDVSGITLTPITKE